jgi:predicted amidohydrolase YtcJ
MKIIKTVVVISVLLVSLTACGGAEKNDAAKPADTIIMGSGSVYLTSSESSAVDAVAIADGTVIFAGSAKEAEAYKDESTEIIKLAENEMAMPGFVEAHAHGNAGGVATLYEVDLYTGAESVADYQAILKDYIANNPDQDFIRANGWINGFAPAGGFTKEMLDETLPADRKDVPIAAVSSDHHSYWVNTAALDLMYEKTDLDKNGKTPNPTGGVIERNAAGEPTGVFREGAQSYVAAIIPEYTVDELKEGILAYQNEVASYGVTAYWDPMVGDSENILRAYQELEAEDKLLIRTFAGYQVGVMDHLSVLDTVLKLIDENKGGMFEIEGVKIFADGVVEGHTAFLEDNYYDADNKGEAPWPQNKLEAMITKADSLRIKVHVHAIGDAATKQTLDAFAAAMEANGTKPGENRHAITHLQLVDPADVQRMVDLGVVAVPNPYWFCQEPGYFTELEYSYLGPETYDGKYPGGRAFSEYPMKAFFDAGITVAMASDYPVTNPARPLDAVETGILRIDRYGDPASELNPLKNPEAVKPVLKDGVITGFENLEIDPALRQNVTLEQMLETATYGGAFSLFCEDRFGTLKVGMEADIIILDKNIYQIEPQDIGGNELPYVLPEEEVAALGPADYGITIMRTLLGGTTIFSLESAS